MVHVEGCWVLCDLARGEAVRRCINNQISSFLLVLSSVLVPVTYSGSQILDLIQTHFMGHFTIFC